jgi:hypothetical protein
MKIVDKFHHPTRFDAAPAGQIWRVICDEDKYPFYIQLNPETDSPNWVRVGIMLEKAFEHKFEDPEFLKECLIMFEQKK